MTSQLEIWRVGIMCALWALALALILSGVEGFWLWVAFGAAIVATALTKGRGSDGGGGGWYGDGDGDGGGDGGG